MERENEGIVSRIMMGQLRAPADRSLYFRPFPRSAGALIVSRRDHNCTHTYTRTETSAMSS